MKILTLSDEPDTRLWDRLDKESLEQADLILSAGDLPATYLSFLTVYTHAPIVYVAGNHDTLYETQPPEGCINADGKLVVVNGVRILGLGGSYRYKTGKCMYTEHEMRMRMRNVLIPLGLRRGFDILLTHAPARGLGDLEDTAHRGFDCFCGLMKIFHPALMVHGHVHQEYTGKFIRERSYAETRIVNAYRKYLIEVEFEKPGKHSSEKPGSADRLC